MYEVDRAFVVTAVDEVIWPMSFLAVHRPWLWSRTPAGSPSRGWAAFWRPARVAPPLEAGERLLAESKLRDGGTAVATDRALIISTVNGSRRRVSWADVAEAGWSSSSASTVVTTWPEANAGSASIELRTDQRFAALVAQRVASAQVLRRQLLLSGTVVGTVVATRVSASGEIRWRVMVDADATNDPAVAAAASRVVADLRSLTGC